MFSIEILMQNRSAFKWLGWVEKLAVCGMPLNNFTAYLFGNIDHPRVKITNPVHLIIIVTPVRYLEHIPGSNNQGCIYPFTLMLGHDSEEDSESLAIGLKQLMP